MATLAKKAPNPTDKHVGSRVRMRRMMLGMSQEKLGDSLGLTFQQIQKVREGHQSASAPAACSRFLIFFKFGVRFSSKVRPMRR